MDTAFSGFDSRQVEQFWIAEEDGEYHQESQRRNRRNEMASDDSSYHPVAANVPRNPRPKKGGMFVFLVFIVGLALAMIFFFPGVRNHLGGLVSIQASQKMNPTVLVWADKQAGNYYCAGSLFYGKRPGSYMRQGNALTLGFQPDLGRYCREEQIKDSVELKGATDAHPADSGTSSPQLPSKFSPKTVK